MYRGGARRKDTTKEGGGHKSTNVKASGGSSSSSIPRPVHCRYNGSVSRPAPQLRSRTSSGSDVARLARGSPLRPPKSSGSAVYDAEEGSVRLEWGDYQAMVQDIVMLKTNLHKLKRVLQEAEVLNPFDNTLKNGLYYSLAHSEGPLLGLEKGESEGREEVSAHEEVADLRRQVVFLQQQMSDKDRSLLALNQTVAEKERTISLLQQQMTKYSGVPDCEPPPAPASPHLPCNAATQTERVRPLSTGGSLSESYPSDNGTGGPLVSLNENLHRKSSSSLRSPPHSMSPSKNSVAAKLGAGGRRQSTPDANHSSSSSSSTRSNPRPSGLPRKLTTSPPKT